ncbi:hypothetical protein [Chamaesiphon sp.]|uniref:hypothetical protein n=1 Tax=Chamaesiphon sp. TaxID=2814140 RepID=UPI0035932E73
MKVVQSIVVSAVLCLSNSVVTMANVSGDAVVVSQSSVIVTTDADGGQVQSTTVSLDRADLSQPHILRVQGYTNNAPVRMERVEVKMNGKVIKTISNNSLELNLAPMMKAGRYEVEISGIAPRTDDTILVSFTGKNTNVTQQFSGSGRIDQKLVIDVQ